MGSSSLAVALTIILEIIQGIHGARFAVVNNVEQTEAGEYFNSVIGELYGKDWMKRAANYIWNNFEQWTSYDQKAVKKITLYIDESDEASTYKINDKDCEIHISAKKLKSLEVDKLQVRQKFKELVFYEMTHILQWTGNNEIPKALKDGIAAFMVLKLDYEPKGWAIKGEGDRWDQKFDVTARFLEYCRDISSTDFIAKLNRRLKNSYNEEIFPQLLQKTIDQLWTAYKTKYKHVSEKNA